MFGNGTAKQMTDLHTVLIDIILEVLKDKKILTQPELTKAANAVKMKYGEEKWEAYRDVLLKLGVDIDRPATSE